MSRTVFAAMVLSLLVGSGVVSQGVRAEEPAAAPEAVRVPLRPRVLRTWDLEIPDAEPRPVGTALRIGDRTYAVREEGTGALGVDTDGDGAPDVQVEAPSGVVVLDPEGRPYAVRLAFRHVWTYASTSVLTGKAFGTKLKLVDRDHDGRFDEIGEDAIVVGHGRTASFLSEVVSLQDELYRLRVAEDGSLIELEPYTGERGSLVWDVETRGKLTGAVLVAEGGRRSFVVRGNRGSEALPAGRYRLHSGRIRLGTNHVLVRPGRSESVYVSPLAPSFVLWGGPLEAEFAYARRGRELQFDPERIRYFGRGGEEYVAFSPFGASPEIRVMRSSSGKELAKVTFPGSC